MCFISYEFFLKINCFLLEKTLKCFNIQFRSSHLEVLCKKGVLRNFPKFTGKHLCQSVFFLMWFEAEAYNFILKKLWHRCSENFAKFLRTPFLTEHLQWLLLKIDLCRRISKKVLRKLFFQCVSNKIFFQNSCYNLPSSFFPLLPFTTCS